MAVCVISWKLLKSRKLIYGRDNHEMNMLPSLADRREDLAKRFFNSLINPTNCLHYLLPPKRDINVISKLRHVKLFACPTTRTERFKNSTIIYALNNFQWHFYLRFYSLTFMLFLSSRKAAIHNKLVYYYVLLLHKLWKLLNHTWYTWTSRRDV